jgi:hypothetical protein
MEERKFLTLPGLELRPLQPVASRYTDYATPASNSHTSYIKLTERNKVGMVHDSDNKRNGTTLSIRNMAPLPYICLKVGPIHLKHFYLLTADGEGPLLISLDVMYNIVAYLPKARILETE